MKNLRLSIGMLAVAAGVVSALASAPGDKAPKAGEPLYYWFDTSGNYLGQNVKTYIQNHYCGPEGQTVCARAYPGKYGIPGNEHPEGSEQDYTTKK